MADQKLFRTKYVDRLLEDVNSHKGLEVYYGRRFPIDNTQVLSVPRLQQPEGLLSKMRVDDNCASGIALFEAYPVISALQAADSRLWVYLAHADLFAYVRDKWAQSLPSGDDRLEKMKSNVRIHWFGLVKDGNVFQPMRHALANLWWSVFVSVDRKATSLEDKYKYTKLIFKNENFRTRTATGFLGRNREALYGILNFMEEHPDFFASQQETAFNEITKFLNCLGGNTQLSFMKRDFFQRQLEENMSLLSDKIETAKEKRSSENKTSTYVFEEDVPSSVVEEPLPVTDYWHVKDTIRNLINRNK